MFDSGYPFFHFIGFIVSGVVSIFLFLVAAALIFILVRFLLVATKAAQIYVAKNSPAEPAAPIAIDTPSEPSPTPPKPATVVSPPVVSPPPATTPSATKPPVKRRTPKSPPAV